MTISAFDFRNLSKACFSLRGLKDVYILIDASLTEDEESPEFAQKMNICAYCLDDDILEEIAS